MRRFMLTRLSPLLASGATLAFISCFPGPLDVEGARCPCPDGYACVAERCERDAGSGGGAALPDCQHRGQFSLEVRYVTPNMAAIAWSDFGVPGFNHFELLVGEGTEVWPPDDPSRYRRIVPAERPELGFTDVLAGEPNIVLVDGLEPAKTYWASGLIFSDDPRRACEMTSAATIETPAVPPGEATIFADDIVGDMAYLVPANFQRASGELRFDASCAQNPTSPGCTTCCYENAIIGFPGGVPLASTIGTSPGLWVPYLEAEISFEPPAGAPPLVQAQRFYAVVTHPSGAPSYRLDLTFHFTLPTGPVARRIQIPFSMLEKVIDPEQRIGGLTPQDATGEGLLTSFVIGGEWREGTVVRMDNVKIRY